MGGREWCPGLSGYVNTLELHVEWVDLFLKRRLSTVAWMTSQNLLELAFKALSPHSRFSFSSLSHPIPIPSPLSGLDQSTHGLPCLTHSSPPQNCTLRDLRCFLSYPFPRVQPLSHFLRVSSYMTAGWSRESFPLSTREHKAEVLTQGSTGASARSSCNAVSPSRPCGVKSLLLPGSSISQEVIVNLNI